MTLKIRLWSKVDQDYDLFPIFVTLHRFLKAKAVLNQIYSKFKSMLIYLKCI